MSVGADIHDLRVPIFSLKIGHVIDEMQRVKKPIVAAIQGMALGGGLEVALGCHYRIAHAEVTAEAPYGIWSVRFL